MDAPHLPRTAVRVRTCTATSHELLKASDALWSTLEFPASGRVQVFPAYGDEPEERLELRNCTCGSTLARRLP